MIKHVGVAIKKIMLVFGTRPEAIKMCPLIRELQARQNIEVIVCVTGQHRQMLDQVLEVFEITPDYDLSIMREKQTLFDISISILSSMRTVIESTKPDIVLVHGDTTTTFITSLVCFYLHIKVGHVEAGLRTHNIYLPYPEEFNRQAVSIISSYNFAPTEVAKQNLISEGKDPSTIYVTGNTGIDALRTTIKNEYQNEHLSWAMDSKLIILTAHRRENIGEPIYNIFRAVKKIVEENGDIKVIFPLHLNPVIRKAANDIFQNNDRIRLIEPLNVIDFHNFMKRAFLILTDSGGIQEEATSLGKPVLVLRDITERQEGIDAGTLKLVGVKEENIYENIKLLLDNHLEYTKMSQVCNQYGDGFASKRIADILCC
ncbi:MAG: mnaA [Herbinix sp.]|jgi:UDP-N-acetylglucosamine 2-epimerase (non-hydrolysing)|nr:mnaA [Herbinix sp.]